MIAIKGGRKPANVAASTSNRITAEAESSSSTISPVQRKRTTGKTNVLKFDSKDLKFIRKDPNGSVVLSVQCEVDVIEAMRNEISTLGVTFEKLRKDLTSASQSQAALTPEQALNNILTDASESERKREESSKKIVHKAFIDTTAYFDNSTASTLSKVGKSKAREALGVETVVTMESPRKLKQSADNVPQLQTPRTGPNNAKKRLDTSHKQLMTDLILKESKSPAALFGPRVTYNTVEESVAGTSRPFITLTGRSADLVNTVLGGSVVDQISVNDTTSDTSETDLVPVMRKQRREKVTVQKFVKLSRRKLRKMGNNVIVKISAFGDPDLGEIDTVGCTVDISSKITSLGSVNWVENAQGNGISGEGNPPLSNILEERPNSHLPRVDQHEPTDGPGQGGTNSGPDIFTLPRGPTDPWDNDWVLWGQSGIGTDSGGFLGGRETGGGAFSGGSGGIGGIGGFGTATIVGAGSPSFSPLSPTFATFIVPSPTRHLATASPFYGKTACAETDNKFIALSTLLRKNGITVKITNFQGEYTVGVVKRNLTLNEKNFKYLDVKEPIKVVTSDTPSLTFVDKNVKENHIYEYRAKIFTKAGREIVSTGKSIIKYQNLSDNLIKIDIGKPKMMIDTRGQVDIQFRIRTKILDSSISAVTEILKNQNLDNFFTDDLVNNRKKFKDLIVLGIQRIDMTRGIKEDFGIFTGTVFSDKENRKLANVSPLKANREYRYIVTAFLRDADSLIPTVTRVETDENTDQEYEFSPAKFLHPETLVNSTLRSKKTIDKGDLNEEFKAGFSGSQTFVDVATKTAKPRVVGGSCSVNENGNHELRWKVKGTTNKINHFVIVGTENGMRSIVGKTHPFSPNRTYRYEDKVLSKNVGSTTYSVIPVYNDMSMGKEFRIGTATGRKSKRMKNADQ